MERVKRLCIEGQITYEWVQERIRQETGRTVAVVLDNSSQVELSTSHNTGKKAEMLEKINNQIRSLIKNTKVAEGYFWIIEDIVWNYDNPYEASKILAECFEKYVKYTFNEENFRKFIRSIDPMFVPQSDIQHAIYIGENSDTDCPCVCIKECDTLDSKECERNLNSHYKQNKILENKKNPQRMQDMKLYALLQLDKITDQDRLTKELAPNTGSDFFSRNRVISTPLGGQPGYKIRRRYK